MSLGRHHKIPETEQLKEQEVIFHSSEEWEESGAHDASMIGFWSGLSSRLVGSSSLYPHVVQKDRTSFLVYSFIRTLIPS